MNTWSEHLDPWEVGDLIEVVGFPFESSEVRHNDWLLITSLPGVYIDFYNMTRKCAGRWMYWSMDPSYFSLRSRLTARFPSPK